MSIHLTPQQLQTLDGQRNTVPRVIDPRTNTAYVLIPAEEYDSIRELLDEERERQAIHEVAIRNAAGRMDEEP